MRILAIRGRNLASLYGDFELSLDRGPIAEAGLFSIAGPTGAGKSTLIDALCLALYNDTPRFDERGKGVKPGRPDQDEGDLVDANDRRNLLSRGTGEGYAEVDFECIDGRSWRARWEVRRARGKPDGRFQNVQMTLRALDGAEVYSGVADVKRRVVERVGYSFAEFRRAVVLPQFEFRAFLDADEDTRAQILERVTGTEIYARLSRGAHEKANAARSDRDALLQRAGDVQPLAPTERKALEHRAAALLTARKAAGGAAEAADADVRWLEHEHVLAGELAAAEQDLAAASEQVHASAPRRRLLAEVEIAEPLRAARNDAERAVSQAREADGTRAAAALAAGAATALRDQRVAERNAVATALKTALAEGARLRPELERARALDVRLQD
ncbi:MAG TPA: AAA family ATPase, partial [Gemmatimonadaceae bacterium]|nr:AAA family ATPase [Gemmatimonadaceae bacterium]